MTLLRNVRPHLLALLILGSAGCAGSPREESAHAADSPAEFDAQVECNPFQAREVLLRLRWPAAGPPDARIEISPYKDGFASGRFVTTAGVPATIPASGFALQSPDARAAAAQTPGVAALRLQSRQLVNAGRMNEAVLGGLIPGLTYYVRVSGIAGAVKQVRAPVCPVDFIEEPAEQRK